MNKAEIDKINNLLDAGKYDEAIIMLKEHLGAYPKDADAWFQQGSAHYGKGDWDRAIEDYDEAIRLKPDYAEAYHNRGSAYNEKGELEQAIEDYDEAIRLKPDYADAYHYRGLAYNKKGGFDDAISDYNEVTRLQPDSAEAYLNRGNAYINKGNSGKAIADYNEAIRIDPGFPTAYNNRGLAYSKKGELELAIADYDEALRLDPKNADAYHYRGLAYSKKGELELAIADYDEALRLDPKNACAWFSRGEAFHEKGDHSRAIADFSEAIRLDEKYFEAWNNRGDTFYENGDFDRAIADFSEAIKIRKDRALTWIARGKAYGKKGDLRNAFDDFDEASKLEPFSPIPYYTRSLANHWNGNSKAAITDIKEAIRIKPTYAEAWNTKGVIYNDLGERDKAIDDYTKAIKFDPKQVGALYNRGNAFWAKARERAADNGFHLMASEIEEYKQAFQDLVRAGDLCPPLCSKTSCYLAQKTKDLKKAIREEVWRELFELSFRVQRLRRKCFYGMKQGKAVGVSEVAHYSKLLYLKCLATGKHGADYFQFSNVKWMKHRKDGDPEEGEHFFGLMEVLLESNRAERGWLKQILKYHDEATYIPVYIGSFLELGAAQEEEQDYMWKHYGMCKMIFNLSRFSPSPQEIHRPSLENQDVMIGLEDRQLCKVIYLDEQEQIDPSSAEGEKIQESMWGIAQALEPILDKIRDFSHKEREKETQYLLRKLTRELLDGARYLFKTWNFRKENEVRLLIIRSPYNDELSYLAQEIKSEDGRYYLEADGTFRPDTVLFGEETKEIIALRKKLIEQNYKVRSMEPRELYLQKDHTEVNTTLPARSLLRLNETEIDQAESLRNRQQVETNKNEAAAIFLLARAHQHLMQGSGQKALDAYSEARRLMPKNATMWASRGVAYATQGNFMGMISDYSEALKLQPRDASLWITRGVARSYIGEVAEALSDCSEAIRLEPENAEYWCERGLIYYEKGEKSDLKKANADFNEVLKRQPDHAEAKEGLEKCAIALADSKMKRNSIGKKKG